MNGARRSCRVLRTLDAVLLQHQRNATRSLCFVKEQILASQLWAESLRRETETARELEMAPPAEAFLTYRRACLPPNRCRSCLSITATETIQLVEEFCSSPSRLARPRLSPHPRGQWKPRFTRSCTSVKSIHLVRDFLSTLTPLLTPRRDPELFDKRKKYDSVLVWQSRHPILNEYIAKAIGAVGEELGKVTTSRAGIGKFVCSCALADPVEGVAQQGGARDQGGQLG